MNDRLDQRPTPTMRQRWLVASRIVLLFLFPSPAGAQSPVITGVKPNPVIAMNAPQPFTILGTNFSTNCSVTLRWEDKVFANRPISSRGPTHLTVTPNFTTNIAHWTAQVVDPVAGSSDEYPFQVVADTAAPMINKVSPNPVIGSDEAQPFIVYGDRLVPGYSIRLWPANKSPGVDPFYYTIPAPGGTQAVIHPVFGTGANTWFVDVISAGGLSSGRLTFQVAPAPTTPAKRSSVLFSPRGFAVIALAAFGLAAIAFLHFFYWPWRLRLERDALVTQWRRDLHDCVKAELDRISLASQAAQFMTCDPVQLRKKLEEITASSQRAGTWISTRLGWRSSKSVQLNDFVDYLRHWVDQMLRTSDIKYQVESPAALPEAELQRHWCDELILVLTEALQNVVKHSNATQVTLRLHWKRVAENARGQRFEITVHDDGRGLPKELTSPLGHGLVAMRQRVEALKGEFHASADPGQGTTLTITLPWPPKVLPKRRKWAF